MNTSPRWLWVTAELPEALSTGRLVYSAKLADAVADTGVELTMVGVGGKPPPHPRITWHPVAAELRGGWKSLASKLPNLSYACAVPEMRAAVAALASEPWDVVVIDHLQTAWAMETFGSRRVGGNATTVFVTHNHEASVRRRVATEAPLRNGRRIVLTVDAWKAARLEKATSQRADLVTSITEEDRRRFAIDAPDVRHLVLAPGWSGEIPDTPIPMAQRPRRIGILGSFDWHVKQENLRRFLPVADPILQEAGIELAIGGRIPDDFKTEMEAKLVATRFVGWVESTADFLAQCRFGVIAEPLGGGFKMKTLDYVFHRSAVASLSGSISGVPLVAGQTMIEAASSESLANAIVASIDDDARLETMTESAFAACKAEFTWERRASRFIDELAALKP